MAEPGEVEGHDSTRFLELESLRVALRREVGKMKGGGRKGFFAKQADLAKTECPFSTSPDNKL